ncbi:MFS transporter [Paraclostridium bifermentans]|nr:MFS transporter [Paraclostridium bifermentans]
MLWELNNLLKTYEGLSKEVYVLFIGRIVNSLGAFVHPLMALILTRKIRLSVSEAGMFITILSAFQAPANDIWGGKLADTIGRRKVIIICQFLGALTLIACGFMKPR